MSSDGSDPLRDLVGESYAAGRTLSGGLDASTELSGLGEARLSRPMAMLS